MSALRTDLNYAASATFRVNVTAVRECHVRVYHANPKYNGTVSCVADNFDVWAEGVFQYNVKSVAAVGLTPAQSAALSEAQFAVADLGDLVPAPMNLASWRLGLFGTFDFSTFALLSERPASAHAVLRCDVSGKNRISR